MHRVRIRLAAVSATITLSIFVAFSRATAADILSLWNGGTGDWIESTNWVHMPTDPGADYPHNGALTYNVTFASGEAILPEYETIEVGTLWMTGGSLRGDNNLILNQGFQTSGGPIHLDVRQIEMRGTSVWDAALVTIGPYTFEISNHGVQELSDVRVTLLDESAYSTYLSHGLFRKARGTGTAIIGGGENRFVSDGTIECLSGILTFLLPCEIEGRIYAAPGAEVRFDFGLLPFTTFRQTTFAGDGLILLTNGPSKIDITATNAGTLVLQNAPLGRLNLLEDVTFFNESNAVLRAVGATELDGDIINHGQLLVEGPGAGFSPRSTIFNYGLFVVSDPAALPWPFGYAIRNFGQVRFENTAVFAALTPNYGSIYATNCTFYFDYLCTNFGTLSTSSDGLIQWNVPYTFGPGSSLRGRLSGISDTFLAGDTTNHGLFYFEQRLEGPGDLYIADGGTVAWAGNMSGPGKTIIQSGGSLIVSGGESRLSGRTIINETGNTLRWDTGERLTLDSGQIINRGNLEITHAMIIDDLASVLRNEGTMRFSSTNGGIMWGGESVLTNTGQILIDATALFLRGTLVQTSGSTSIEGGAIQAQPYEATLHILGGTLSVHGTVECTSLRVDSTLSIGASSVVTAGQLQLTNTSVVEIEIGPTGSGHLQTSFPDWSVNGTLRLRLADGFFPTVGTRYVLITHGFPAVAFSRYEGLEIGRGLRLVLHNADAQQFHVVVMNAPQPGQKALTLTLPPFPSSPLVLSWPPEFAGFYLQYTTNLSQPNWETLGLTWTNDFHPSIITDRQGFFRLIQP
jgi:hypothetical protein